MDYYKHVLTSADFLAYTKAICKPLYLDDLRQEVLITMLSKGEDFLSELHASDKLVNYAIRIAKLKIIDSSKRFAKKHDVLPSVEKIEEIESSSDLHKQKAVSILSQMELEYLGALAKCGGSVSKLAEQTSIHRNYLSAIFTTIKEKARVEKKGKHYTAIIKVDFKCIGDIDKVMNVLDNTSVSLNSIDSVIINKEIRLK